MGKDKTLKVRYVGQVGGSNAEVGRATRRSGLMVVGEDYEVPEALGLRLIFTAHFVESPKQRSPKKVEAPSADGGTTTDSAPSKGRRRQKGD